MFYPLSTLKHMRKHALECYPNVSVGFLIGNEYWKATNCAADTIKDFDVASYAWFTARHRRGLQAVVVSKPNNQAYPNAYDMQRQIEQNIPWMLVANDGKKTKNPIMFGDSSPMQSLYGRHFRHGISDCYSLVRDYYRLNFGIILRDYPRDWDWWNTDLQSSQPQTDLYEHYFKSAGFRETNEEDARNSKFGCMLLKFKSDRINHAAVITGPKRFVHHISARRPVDFKRISLLDSIHMWYKYVYKWVIFDEKLYTTLENPHLENSKNRNF